MPQGGSVALVTSTAAPALLSEVRALAVVGSRVSADAGSMEATFRRGARHAESHQLSTPTRFLPALRPQPLRADLPVSTMPRSARRLILNS